jgi:D-sedoheptulose 7-phosphate isomerase
MGRYQIDRAPLPALALTVDTSALTAIGNDYGYQDVSARQIRGIGVAADVLVALSTSGNSANVIKAAKVARGIGVKVVGLTGADDSKLAEICDISIRVPSNQTNHIQEMHIAVGHMVCGLVEAALSMPR